MSPETQEIVHDLLIYLFWMFGLIPSTGLSGLCCELKFFSTTLILNSWKAKLLKHTIFGNSLQLQTVNWLVFIERTAEVCIQKRGCCDSICFKILFKNIKLRLKWQVVSLPRSLRGIEWPFQSVTRCTGMEQAVLHQLNHNQIGAVPTRQRLESCRRKQCGPRLQKAIWSMVLNVCEALAQLHPELAMV